MINLQKVLFVILFLIALLGANWLRIGEIKYISKSSSVGGSSLYNIYTIPTNASSTIGTTSSLIVATSTARQYLTLVNDSATIQYISIGAPAVSGKGIRLNANGGAYELKADQMFTAAVYGISSATGSISYIESKQ